MEQPELPYNWWGCKLTTNIKTEFDIIFQSWNYATPIAMYELVYWDIYKDIYLCPYICYFKCFFSSFLFLVFQLCIYYAFWYCPTFPAYSILFFFPTGHIQCSDEPTETIFHFCYSVFDLYNLKSSFSFHTFTHFTCLSMHAT